MFSLGFFGIFLVAAIPLFFIYALAGCTLKIAIFAANHSNAPVAFSVSSGSVAKISFFAWLTGLALFFACITLNHWLTQYSGNTILRMYPTLQNIASLALFFNFLRHRVTSKREEKILTNKSRLVWSLTVSSAPTLLLVAASNIWHLSQRHP